MNPTPSLLFVLAGLSASLAAAHGADAITVLTGAGQDTTVVNAFLPGEIHVAVGTTVTWRLNGDEFHTVTFLGGMPAPAFVTPAPGESGELAFNPQVAFPTRMPDGAVESYDGTGYVNSGFLTAEPAGPDAPPSDIFSLTFTAPGVYEYACLIHPGMVGRVVVTAEATADTPTHEQIDAAAAEAEATLLARVDAARAESQEARSEPGPNGTTVWYVKAGAMDFVTADPLAQAFEFLPKELTIKAGDTVVWSAPDFHTVTFVPLPPTPEVVLVREQEAGPPLLVLNPEVFAAAKPDGVYDPLFYYNSAPLGPSSEGGHLSWSLTFDEPGSYEYVCALHEGMGMKGTITVVAR